MWLWIEIFFKLDFLRTTDCPSFLFSLRTDDFDFFDDTVLRFRFLDRDSALDDDLGKDLSDISKVLLLDALIDRPGDLDLAERLLCLLGFFSTDLLLEFMFLFHVTEFAYSVYGSKKWE